MHFFTFGKFNCEDGKTLHLRKATRAEPEQKEIYYALGLTTQPGCTQKTITKIKKENINTE